MVGLLHQLIHPSNIKEEKIDPVVKTSTIQNEESMPKQV